MLLKYCFKLIALLLALNSPSVLAKDVSKPELMMAKVYHKGVDLNNYWVSEKFDGVRALWNGKQFVSRGGNIYHAPKWFVRDFPKQRLDGELWISRQSFELLVSTVRDKTPDDKAWKKVKFMVFDVPDVDEIFDQRLEYLHKHIIALKIPWLKVVEQIKVKDHQALMDYLDTITNLGAEGLMLHKGSSLYTAKRNSDLLKVKPYTDAEATVIGHILGKGKYKNQLGALVVSLENGIKFKIGTGFSDAERKNPPNIGSVITFQYRGVTKNQIPRFASFLRVRGDYEASNTK